MSFGVSQWKDMQATVQNLNDIVSQSEPNNQAALAAAVARGPDGAIFGGMYAEEIDLATRRSHLDMQGKMLLEVATQLEETADNVSLRRASPRPRRLQTCLLARE